MFYNSVRSTIPRASSRSQCAGLPLAFLCMNRFNARSRPEAKIVLHSCRGKRSHHQQFLRETAFMLRVLLNVSKNDFLKLENHVSGICRQPRPLVALKSTVYVNWSTDKCCFHRTRVRGGF